MDEHKKVQLDRKFYLLFETAKRSLLTADMLAKQVISDLKSFESDIESGVNIAERAAPTLVAAMGFVDFAFRFGEVIKSLPYARKNAPEMKKLEDVLKVVEECRHHLQHMRGDLCTNDDITYPLLGSLSWANGMNMYSLSFSQKGTVSTPSVIFDTLEKKWVSTHTFVVKHEYIDIDNVLEEMQTYYKFLCSIIYFTDTKIMELEWGNTYAFTAKLMLRQD